MEDFVKLVKETSVVHPARDISFKELREGLFAEIEKDNINVSYHPEFPGLAIFKYSLNCVFERNWNKFTLMARGLILDLKAEVIVATPFLKFHNYNEIVQAENFIEPEFTVMEKVDGSLGIMFFYAGEWRISTAGGFSSEQAIWAMVWMKKNMDLNALDKTNTYLFEIVYSINKIVVKYDYEGLVLLNVIDRFGLDYDPVFLKKEAEHLGTRCAKIYGFSDMDSILKKAETLDLSEEGYVIRFKSGIRLKIKGDEYVRIHKIISKVTPLAIWESMLCGDNLEDIKKELPEEMEKDFDTMVSIFEVKLAAFIKEVVELYEGTKSKSDKELGLYMSTHPEAFSGCEFKTSKSYIFTMRKGQFYDKLNNLDPKQLMRRKVFSAFKPKANFLEGYTSSSAVNRFTDNV